jgi:hypothetical protein
VVVGVVVVVVVVGVLVVVGVVVVVVVAAVVVVVVLVAAGVAAATAAVGFDVAVVEPFRFVAMTITHNVDPMSDVAVRYVAVVWPAIGVHAAPAELQRAHWNEYDGFTPDQSPVDAASVCVESAAPVIVGRPLLLGACCPYPSPPAPADGVRTMAANAAATGRMWRRRNILPRPSAASARARPPDSSD